MLSFSFHVLLSFVNMSLIETDLSGIWRLKSGCNFRHIHLPS
nr:MAG TPA: hypothetical protein [Caudoviricetes sp.]DAH23332.1 MAG TPA: hypothetical protein [Caudoviricetes sp.]DAH95137.1 MAG TPA: hypothetical protein [Caudoviricetes sp.]